MIELAFIAYLLFVIPGFCLVWSYRHFAKSDHKIGDFEYAAWGLLWGVFLIILFELISKPVEWLYGFLGIEKLEIIFDLQDSFALIGSLASFSLVLATLLAVPLGWFLVYTRSDKLFHRVDKFLFKLIKKNDNF